ncbi:MAG TPA: 1-(5-phosphoribosyl)-5-[(5-phosphoribosylamino)methylideneamino]imidazole-4-carboxamide isomerase [Clostridia bacterium]|nr:1-(5-phosphoribosyl)-5-[(5-phosphoribosylamino)methylideneamino]imidazole-4-carboxamide isomerase [Clostridia bacterium]
MLIIPAIDLREGQCVRLLQGDPEQMTVFSDDPVETAKQWEELGAPIIHLVDLDGAFIGEPQNLDVVEEISRAVSVPLQLGGGVRTMATIERALAAGVERVVLGTAAIADPDLVQEACRRFGERITVGIDAKDGLVAVEGWEATVEKTFLELGHEVKNWGVNRIIFTDTRRDGTMRGPNLESIRLLAEELGINIIAAGGVSSMDDLRALKELEPFGLEGVIVGKALYMGTVDLREAVNLFK